MERSTEPKATSDGARLNRVQMARALREGAGAEDGRGAEQRITSVGRNWRMDSGLRRVGASVTLGVLLASTLTGGRITALRADFLQHAAAGGGGGGSIPGSPGPSVGSDGQSHSPIQDTNQEQQKKMFSKLTGVTAAIAVGASVTVAGAQNAAVQWKVSEGGNGHWYMLDLSRRPWTGAADRASALGGHLVTVNSYAEHVFLRSSVFTYCCSMSDTWMGATRSSTDEEYHWVTGEQFVPLPEIYFNNNSAGWDAPALYLEQVIRFSWVGEWGGESNSANEGNFSVVEWSADCNNDGIVDYGQCHDGSLPDFNCNNIPDCCEHGEVCIVGSYPVQWRTADGGNGHWYQGRIIDSAGVKWSRARDEAQRLGGDLVVLGSPQATAWVWEHVASQPSLWSAHFGPWVGARQPSGSMEPDGGWTWVDGTPVREFVPWAPGQPDDYTPCGGANDFMSYFKNFQSSPQNLMCDNADVAVTNCPGGTMGPTMSAIVEWSRDCNHDGVVDYGQILGGELSDGNHNGIPDICEFLDCNRDGLSDLDQVAHGQLPDYDGNNIPDCCDRGEACVVGGYPVQWRTASGGNGHWYQAMSWSAPKTWPDALGGAQGLGGLLACVTSASENDWIAAHSDLHQPGCPGGSDGWHLGGYQDFTAADYSEPSGGWRWISGEPWSYTAWLIDVPGGDRPNNYGPGGEQYLKMSELPYAPRWDDVGTGNGNTMCGAIIEWSADCNNDGTVDYGQILRGDLPDINHNGTPDTCECIGDIYVDRAINGADLGALLAYWGPTTSAAASRACDLNGDGVVNGSDLGVLLAYWGPCSN